MLTTAEKEAAYSLRDVIRDLRPLVRPHLREFALGTFFAFTCQLVWLYPPYALASIVDYFTNYTPGDSLRPVFVIGALWSVASVYHYLGREIAGYFGFQVAERIANDAQQRTLIHMLRLDLRWHEIENTGNKVKRIQKGGEGIDKIIRIWFDYAVESAVNFVGMVFILAQFDFIVAGATIAFLVTYFLISHPLTARAGGAARAVNAKDEDVSGLTFEIINNIRSVKVLGMQPGLVEVATREHEGLFALIVRRINAYRVREAVLNMWGQIFRLGILFYITWGIVHGQYEIGFLVLFYNYFNYIWESISKLSRVILDYVIGKYGFMRMKQILDEPVGIDSEEGKRGFPKDWNTIEVKNLSFSYGDADVLRGVSFKIHRGQRTGIVGLSGAGKSTLFKLLLKEHEHYQGEILIDGVNLRDIRRSDFFVHTAVVLQDTEVFNFTLKENIALANPMRTGDAALLQKAIETSHISDFLDHLPQGMDTMIGEKGIKLSGGEKQRLGIARAIFKEPQILFLDEATSHLDLESEEKIRDSLHQFFQSVTAVVIAHRLTTIREMDNIIVLEDGKILEQGSFDELMSQKGRFFELWEMQRF